MILITLGSQKFQFNRLLEAVDQLIEDGLITDTVFAQIGYSDYLPRHMKYNAFLDRDTFSKMLDDADIVITHGGTGAIVGALKRGDKVVAVPRRSKFGEHVDDHQLQLVGQFKSLNLICECDDCNKLDQAIAEVKQNTYSKYESNSDSIIKSIVNFIDGVVA